MSKKTFLILLMVGFNTYSLLSGAEKRSSLGCSAGIPSQSPSDLPMEFSGDVFDDGAIPESEPYFQGGLREAVIFAIQKIAENHRVFLQEAALTDRRLRGLEAATKMLFDAKVIILSKKIPALEVAVQASTQRLEQIESAITQLSQQQGELHNQLAHLAKKSKKKRHK